MGANIAGIYGAQIFRQDDRPRYRRGFAVAIAVLAVGLVLAIGRFLDDRLRRRRSAGITAPVSPREQHSHEDEDKVRPVSPSDIQPPPVLIAGDLKNPVLHNVVR